MSEYQYYEWQTIDRVLTPDEQSLVDQLSSHIDVTASQAVVTYEWGDFNFHPAARRLAPGRFPSPLPGLAEGDHLERSA